MKTNATYEETCEFHGHSCPGLAAGYRVACAALRELQRGRSEDEELVAVVENDACGVDAIQYLCGCTFGKGNLIFRDHGKPAFTFYRRCDGKGVRIYAEPTYYDDADDRRFLELVQKDRLTAAEQNERRQIVERRVQRILTQPESEFMKCTPAAGPLPEPARIFSSEHCSACGERTMATRVEYREGKPYCRPCAADVNSAFPCRG